MSKRTIKSPFKKGTISKRAYERAVKLVFLSKHAIAHESAPKKVLAFQRLLKIQAEQEQSKKKYYKAQ